MDILTFLTFCLNHLSPLQGYFYCVCCLDICLDVYEKSKESEDYKCIKKFIEN